MKRSSFLKSLAGLMVAPKAIIEVANKPKFDVEKSSSQNNNKQKTNKTIKASIYV